MWSISVGDFNSCVCGVCDCLHKTQAQRYSECVLALHETMFHYDIEQIIWRTSKWKRTMHIRWSIKELLLISRIWNNAVHMEWYFKDINHCDSTLVALRNFARCMYSIGE